MTTRHRALQRPLDKIDSLRLEEPALVDPDDRAARARSLTGPRRIASVRAAWRASRCWAVASSVGCSGWRASRSAARSRSSTRSRARRRPRSAISSSARSTTSTRPRRAAEGADVVTYEWEGVPAATARALEALAPVYPPAACARRVPGPHRREGDAARARDRDRAVSRRSTPIADLRAAVDAIGLPGGAEDAPRRLRRQGPGRAARAAPTSTRAWTQLGGGAVHPRGVRRVRPRALDPRRARPRRRGRVLARGREPPPRRHPAAHPRARARSRRRAPGARRGRDPAAARRPRLRRRVLRRAVRRRRRRCSRTRSRRACTTPGTGRSKARRRASSRTTCARSSACRSARPRRAAPSAMVNCIGDDARPRRGRCASRARTCTTTARRRARAASSATSP